MSQHDASTLLKYSPLKARDIINVIRGVRLDVAMVQLQMMKRPQSKNIARLLKNAANNLGITEADYGMYKISSITAEDAQKLYRIKPRARGRADRQVKRYSRIKVTLDTAA